MSMSSRAKRKLAAAEHNARFEKLEKLRKLVEESGSEYQKLVFRGWSGKFTDSMIDEYTNHFEQECTS